MCNVTTAPPTERWMVDPEELRVGDQVVIDYMNVRGLTVERVVRSEPGDGRHYGCAGDCSNHWLIAFEGKGDGHCYTKGRATFRRVIP